MRVGFWTAREGEDVEVNILPVGNADGDSPAGLTASGAVSALATIDGDRAARDCPEALTIFRAIANALDDAPRSARVFSLAGLSDAERTLLFEVLGEGEVNGVVALPEGASAQFTESVLAGVWRVAIAAADGTTVDDYIEVGSIPQIAARAAVDFTAPELPMQVAPDGTMNAMPVLAEISDRVATYRPGDPPHVISFTLLPVNDADMAFLQDCIGNGPVQINSRGYSSCRVLATACRYVWSVQYFNTMDAVVLDCLHIGEVPEVVRAATEDFEDSAVRLREIIEAYFDGEL